MNGLSVEEKRKMLAERVDTVSYGPGVYLMQDKQGQVIYVGKAKNLKKRLSSYFKRESHSDMKTGVLVNKIDRFDTIHTATEKEALILEANLIRKHKPRYNVILKDDKRYPLLRIDVTTDYPNITIARKMKKDGALYFGPYASAGAVHQTLKFINKIFKHRKCNTRAFKNRTRPCLYHQIGICLAPCCLNVEPGAYRKIIDDVSLFLNGKTPELIRRLKKNMGQAAERERFEEAGELRDKVFALEKTLEKQIVVARDMGDRDVVALSRGEDVSLITLMSVRAGVLSGSRHVTFNESMVEDAELIRTFMVQFYENAPYIPPEIIASSLPEDHDVLENWLREVKNGAVRLFVPRRGEKARLIELARHNGRKELEEQENQSRLRMDLLIRLKNRLGAATIPEFIECFDNSNISGTDPVSGMVVFKNGKPLKSAYRKYKIKTVDGQDDYSYMAEILSRRYGKETSEKNLPDLLMVDGGKGQLNIALSILKEQGLEGAFDVIGIAKKDEGKGEEKDKIYTPGRSNPVNFGREDDLLLFLQSIRDEAHRFAITFHRSLRSKKIRLSALDAVPGIGPKRKQMLLTHFGGIEAINHASEDELCALAGMTRKAARDVLRVLNDNKNK